MFGLLRNTRRLGISIRAIGRKAIAELIASRKGAMEEHVHLWCARTGRSPDLSAVLASWTRVTRKLQAKWARQLEADAVASEYQQFAKSRERPSRKKCRTAPSNVRSARHHPIDARKELIATLKARHPNARARRVCELIDGAISRTPSSEAKLPLLPSWREKAPGIHSWVECYDDRRTHHLVRAYVNKVPPLRTAAGR